MYCIYTDRDVPENRGNWDHVIARSLGGLDGFEVWADQKVNADFGSQVEGAMVNDAIYRFALRNAGVKGQSGNPIVPHWRRVTIDGEPYQVTWAPDEVRVWDAKAGSYIDPESIAGKPMTFQTKMDLFAPLRFIAKVALGGGYFVYRDALCAAVDCDALRYLTRLDVEEARRNPSLVPSSVTFTKHYDKAVTAPDGPARMYKFLCEFTGRSIFIVERYNNALSFHVGLVGSYLGTLSIEGDCMAIPEDERDLALGHAVILGPGQLERMSFRALAKKLYDVMEEGRE